MLRDRSLKIVLVLVGMLFIAGIYPLLFITMSAEPAVAMMLSLYVTLGIFLLMAVRDPAAHRSLIGFTAWSSFAHAAVMGWQASRHLIEPRELIGVILLVIIGVALIALAPAKQPQRAASAARA